MASVVVDGLVLPIAVGGHPALDFCNTRAGWGRTAPKEYLHSHAHLALWAAYNGLLERAEVGELAGAARRWPGAAGQVLGRALAFRDALYGVLTAPPGTDAAAARADPAWDGINAEVNRAACAVRLHPSGGVAAWRLALAGGERRLESPLLAVAWSAADLLTTVGPAGVAACPGQGCGWLFHDPRGRRRWCSMAWCGNRAKARRHADRRRPAAGGAS